MKLLRICLILLVFVTACAPVYVNYDYEKGTDFTKHKTYNYYQNMETGLSDLDTKRLLNVLDTKLKTKGYTISENPDFYIDIKSNEYQEAQRNTVGVGVGSGGRNVGGGISIGIPVGQAKMGRKITIDFVEEDGIGLFWQAISESSFKDNLTPEKREECLKVIVDKIFSEYPPKQ